MTLFWGELKRRNVVRVAIAYAVVSWLLLQVADVVLDNIEAPTWVFQAILLLLVIGFPVAIIFAWAFELTPEGLKKEKDVDRSESITHVTGRKLDFVIIGVLVIAVGFLLVDKLYLSEGDTAPDEIIATERKSIAVLPFVNMSDDANNEYFSDGISEEILNLLAQVPEMRVTSRSSAFSFKGQNLDVPTMAAKLNVAHVLEGSVRKSGNELRITAQLIEVVTDTHLWSQTYDRKLENIFAIQDEIAAAVVDALQITLLGENPKAVETNPEAYALYLQGRHFSNQGTAESHKQAETLLKQALAIDSGFAPAWTNLGNVYRIGANALGVRPFEEGNELARDAIQKALAIDPQYGPAYAALAMIEIEYDWDFTAAAQHVQQALALNPGDASILNTAGNLNRYLGRLDEAIDLYRQAVALDPVSYTGHLFLGGSYYVARRLDEAAEILRLAISLNPGGNFGHVLLGNVLLRQGDAPSALAAMEQETSDGFRLTGIAIVQHALGDAEASDAALKELIEKYAAFAAYQVAEAFAFRGEIDHAFDWLEQAYDNRDSGLLSVLHDPLLANLHDDPRWEPLLDKMGLLH
jgi:TolB-like protein/Tfp pilus assembly protein PilF